MKGFNSETAKEAGKKSRRGLDSSTELIRKELMSGATSNGLIKKYFNELKALKGKAYVDSMNQLYKTILPQIKSIDFDSEQVSVNITPIQWVKTDETKTK